MEMSLFENRHYVLLFCPSHKWLSFNDNHTVSSSVQLYCFRYIIKYHIDIISKSSECDIVRERHGLKKLVLSFSVCVLIVHFLLRVMSLTIWTVHFFLLQLYWSQQS
jgi:hypothetical protein